jgi:outer membrane protein assembly factor BamA
VVIGLSPELSGGPLGGDFNHFRLIGDVRGYVPLTGDLVLTARVLSGTVAPFDGTPQIPLWARFYAGGTTTFPVRGYARRRVGPLSGSDDPLGGRTATVGSLELRHPLFGPVSGVLFVDTGDVELSAWSIDPDNFQTGVGFGLRASTPVGPIEADLGFGLNREGGDGLVQFAFSIGPDF